MNSKSCVYRAVPAGDVVVGHAGVHPAHVDGERRCDVLGHVGHYSIVEEPSVVAGWV